MNKVKVLLVEDDVITQRVIELFLKDLNCEVDIASTAQEAKILLENHYNMILMDIGLPDMDGFKIIDQIRKNVGPNQHVPIIVETVNNLPYYVSQGKKSGMTEMVKKPVSHKALKRMLEDYVLKKT